MLRAPDGGVFGGVKVGDPRGQPGLGFFSLIIPVIWELQARPQSSRVTIRDLRGCLMIADERSRVSQHLGLIAPPQAFAVHTQTMDADTPIDFFLDAHRPRIEAVERLRQGGDLTLQVQVSGTVEAADSEKCPMEAQAQAKRVTQASWLKILDAMGYGKAVLVEVPVLSTGVCADLSEAAERLDRAMGFLRRGDYRAAVAASREVLEAIESAPIVGAVDQLPEKRTEWTKAHRFTNLRRALRPLTSAAHHADPNAAAIKWERGDALTVIAMTAAELQRCCEELSERP